MLIRTERAFVCEKLLDLDEEDVKRVIDRIRPKLEKFRDDLIRESMGCPTGHFDWNSVIITKPPYNARDRRRWSDKLIPEK